MLSGCVPAKTHFKSMSFVTIVIYSSIYFVQAKMQHPKKKSNILYSLFNRETGSNRGSQHHPNRTLHVYAEEAASLPNKNLVSIKHTC